jgi:hypothetical protein
MRLAQAVESWHCGLAQNLVVFKAEADFASDLYFNSFDQNYRGASSAHRDSRFAGMSLTALNCCLIIRRSLN